MTVQISSLRVSPEVDASKYVAGTNQKVAADKSMIDSANAVSAAQAAVDTRLNVSADALSIYSGRYVGGSREIQQFTRDLGGLGRALETGKISMEGAEQVIIGMRQKLGLMADGAELAAQGQHMLAAAVERANLQLLKQQNIPKSANSNVRQASSFNSSNLAAQGFDVASTAAFMPFYSVALQQGPQVAQVFNDIRASGQAIGPAVAGAFAQILNPVSLLTIGVIGLSAATIQWIVQGRDGAKSLDDALKGQADTVRLLKQQYGELGDASKRVAPAGGLAFTESQARSQIAAMQAALRDQSGDLSEQLLGGGILRGGLFGSNTAGLDTLLGTKGSQFQPAIDRMMESIRKGGDGFRSFNDDLNAMFETMRRSNKEPAALAAEMERLNNAAIDAFAVSGQNAPFQAEINRLLLGLKEGNGDIEKFASNVRRIGEINGLGEVADKIILSSKNAVSLITSLREILRYLREIDREDTRPGLRDRRDDTRYAGQRDAELRRFNEQFAAEQQLAMARTYQERLAAIEAQVRSRAFEDKDSEGGLEARVARARQAELNRQAMEKREASEARSNSITAEIERQQLELSMIGKTTGEITKMRFEAERVQELRDEARRTGGFVDPKEVAAIQAAADALGKQADAAERLRLIEDLRFEREQLARTEIERTIADKMRGMANDPSLAADIRRTEELKKQVALWEDIRGKGMDAMSSIFDLAFDPSDWKRRLSDLMATGARMIFDFSAKNPLMNSMYGTDLPTLDKTGGLKGLIGTFFGMTPNPAAGQNVGAMNVQAATVMINGATLGAPGMGPLGYQGQGGLPEMAGGFGAASRMFSPSNANDVLGGLRYANSGATRNMSLTESLETKIREAVGAVYGADAYASVYSGGQGAIGTTSRRVGTTRHDLGHAGDLRIFDAQNRQITGDRLAPLGQYWQAKGWGGTGLEMRGGGIHLDEHAGRARNWWYGAQNPAQARGIEAGQQGIFPQLQTTATAASQALDKLAVKSVDAGDGLGGLLKTVFGGPGGVPSMPAMAGAFPPIPAAPAGAGGGGLLDMLFKTLFGFLPGFAGGTDNFPGGFARMNEGGRGEIVKLPRGSQIIPHDVSVKALSAANGSSGFAGKTEMHFHNAPTVERREEQDDGAGGKRIDVWFSEQAAQEATRRGSPFNKALSGMGVRNRTKVR